MEIKRIDEVNDRIGEFINKEFSDYARQNEVTLNYDEFNFVAEDDDGTILGVITGRTTYNEVHIVDLIVNHECRRGGVGSRLVAAVEEAYKGKGYSKITLTTFGFQAPEFYIKHGYKEAFALNEYPYTGKRYYYTKEL